MQMKTSLKERLSYGGFFVGQNIIYMLVLQYVMLFYTDVVGLTTATVGTLFLVARIWDAVNDPIMGLIIDKSKLKGGKFKPWINSTIILLPLATILLFVNIDGSMTTKIIYAYITYIVWGMIYTISDVPIFALATFMTDDIDERVKIMSIGRLAAGIAGIVASVTVMPVVMAAGWIQTAIILSVISFVVMIPIKFYAVERITNKKENSVTVKTIFKTVLKNKYLVIFYGAFFLSSITATGTIAISYFAIYNLGDKSLIAIISLCTALPAIAVPILLPKLISKFGKRNIILAGCGLYVLSMLIYHFIGYENITVVLLFSALTGFFFQVPRMMAGMVTADCIEYGTYTTGERAEGVAFSLQTFINKMSGALSAALGSYLLTFIGYVPNVEQSEAALKGIWNMVSLIPAIGYAGMFIVIFAFYKLTDSEVKRMLNENKESFDRK